MTFRPAGRYGKKAATPSEADITSISIPIDTVAHLKGIFIEAPADVYFRLLVDDDEILNFYSDNAANQPGLTFDPPLAIKGNRTIYLKASHSGAGNIEVVYNLDYYVEDIVSAKIMGA